MPTFNIPGSLITAGVQKNSAAVTPGQDFSGASIVLVDTNGQWPATQDPTRHVQLFGLQQSFDGGQTWEWGPAFSGPRDGDPSHRYWLWDGTQWMWVPNPADPTGLLDAWLPFGWMFKGSLPFVRVKSSDIVGLGTTQLRLAIITDANIRLGATITTS